MKKQVVKSAVAVSLAAMMLTPVSAMADSLSIASVAPVAQGDEIDVEFWSAPNENQFEYWTAKAKAYNEQNREVNGKAAKVTVSMIPETTSSEAAIQNALATDAAPAASENINNSFMATLADSDAVYDIQDEDFYKTIISNKALDDDVTSTWEYNGKQYVIPIYINPICLNWNKKALDALGCEVPSTMDEFQDVIQKFVDNRDKLTDIGCEFTSVEPYFLTPEDYWNRNYDFLMVYDALGGGALYDGNKLTIDPDIAKQAFEFWGQLGNTLCLDEVTDIWTGEQNPELFGFGYPWELGSYTDAGKVYGTDYVFGPTIVNKEGDQPAYYSDSKGIVFYKDSNISDDQHAGAVDFVSWVYSKENCAQSDSDWLTATSMLPVRGDISSNDVFADALKKTPALAFLADAIPDAVAGPTITDSSDAYIALGESGFAPYAQEAVGAEPLQAPDATQYVSDALDAMKSAANLE